MRTKKKLKGIDLFAGAGGLSIGLERSGFDIVFANDIDRDMCATYRLNHPNTYVYEGDITKLQEKEVLNIIEKRTSKLDLLAGGPPCQGFSTVGSKNADDPRNNLFHYFFKMVVLLEPTIVLFENVAGFKTLYHGKAFLAVLDKFRALGYNLVTDILDAVNYGVPQYRKRTIIVGVKPKISLMWPPEIAHAEEANLFNLNTSVPLTFKDALSDLPMIESGETSSSYRSSPETVYQEARRKSCKVLTEHTAPSHGQALLKVIKKVPMGGCIKDIPEPYRPKTGFANTYARLWWDKPSTTVTRNFGTPSSSRCIHPFVNRGLTTREGARLQSFDDDYQFVGSRVSKNLQIGNAVPPLLAEALGKIIFQSLVGEKAELTGHALEKNMQTYKKNRV